VGGLAAKQTGALFFSGHGVGETASPIACSSPAAIPFQGTTGRSARTTSPECPPLAIINQSFAFGAAPAAQGQLHSAPTVTHLSDGADQSV
jgi:hypothetical protein